MLDVSNLIVYINGEFIPGPEASISVFDRGLLYGDAVFEGIREYDGKVFKLDEHIDRLYRSAQIIALQIPFEKPEIKKSLLKYFSEINYKILISAQLLPVESVEWA